MMNRSTQKELIKLLLQLNEMWPQLDLSNTEQQNMVLDILNTVSIKCQKDFSKLNAGQYVDTVESLGNVIKMTDWQHMASEELNQCISLCQEIILQVINNLRNEKELKKDIVFLPYKASMWDSLESVWKAAYEDKEHCNTYVISIPYCDRNPDGSAARWHCEIEDYPEYVPVLDWREYPGKKIEEMRPDIIFIHNPYDEYNLVTSVDEQYYSRNLKRYTNKLVYIPYFVSGAVVSEHMCQSPGIVNADYVIVESETIKEQYERYYPVGNPPKGKFLALGSPKYDKVLSAKKEDYQLPKEWKKLIAGRKIILYNTSLSAQMKNPDHIIRKLTDVLEYFKGNKEVAFWWRPHPLMEATLDSIITNAAEEYRQIRDQFIKEGWGIYDNTQEMNRAIVWSDVYYGDSSSVGELYKSVGKPLLIEELNQNVIGMSFHQFAFKDGKIFFVLHDTNALCSLCIQTGEFTVEAFVPSVEGSDTYSYNGVIAYDDKLLLFPFIGDTLAEYSLSKKEFIIIDCRDVLSEYHGFRFASGSLYGRLVFFHGYTLSGLFVYDCDMHVLTRIADLSKLPIFTSSIGFDHIGDGCVRDVYRYSIVFGTCNIIVTDMDNKKLTGIFQLACRDEKISYVGMASCRDYIWLIAKSEKNIVKFNVKNRKVDMVYLDEDKRVRCNGFEKILADNKNIYLFGLDTKKQEVICVVYDVSLGKIIMISSICKGGIIDWVDWVCNGKIGLTSRYRGHGRYTIVDTKDLSVRFFDIAFNKEMNNKILRNVICKKNMSEDQLSEIYEASGLISMKSLITIAKNQSKENMLVKRKKAGTVIYETILRQ